MAQVTLSTSSGRPIAVLAGSICMPRIGAWHADLTVDTDQAITGAVTIAAPGITLRGTVTRGGVYGGVARVRVCAGADGLRKTAAPKHYTSPTVGVVLRDLVDTAGETIAATADADTLNATLLNWTTLGESTGRMIAALMELAPAGTAWRMLPDGTLWVGAETWPDSAVTDAVIVDEIPEGGSLLSGVTSPAVLPGTTFEGRRLDYVEHTIAPKAIRTRVWSFEGGAMDRIKSALLAMTTSSASDLYRGLYRVRLVSQSADLQKCGVEAEDERIPPMENIPFAHGVPGLKVRVENGAHLLVGWLNGRPDRPFAGLWDTDANALKVVFDGSEVDVGGETGAELAIKGQTYRSAEDSYLAAISKGTAAALSSLGLIPAGAALAAADAAWATAKSGFLATNAKVK